MYFGAGFGTARLDYDYDEADVPLRVLEAPQLPHSILTLARTEQVGCTKLAGGIRSEKRIFRWG